MPVDVSQLVRQLRQMASRAIITRRHHDEQLTLLRRAYAPDFDVASWTNLCATAARLTNLHWNGALFNTPEIANDLIPFGNEPDRYALVATDGSQIMPDRHKSVQYAAIQVGSACIVYGQPEQSAELSAAILGSQTKPLRFLGDDELYDAATGELISAGEISTQRDLEEIDQLAMQVEEFAKAGLQVVAVADGSLVPFTLINEQAVRGNPKRTHQILEHFVDALNRIRACGAIVAGFIDRPNSNTLARACALAAAPPSAATDETLLRDWISRTDRDIIGIYDRHILEDVLLAMQRTALFEPQWLINGSAHLGQQNHTMRACYANISKDKPSIVRLEMPHWCSDAGSVGIITAVMSRHAAMGGGYPLCLKAAHEAAILTHTDERQIDTALERQILSAGIMATPSSKQEAKDRR